MKNAALFSVRPVIYLITKGETTAENFAEKSVEIYRTIKIAVETGVSLIQIREKSLPARLVCELTAEAVRLTTSSNAKILVNDRADIAQATGAGGVHLTAKSLPAQIIRSNFPPDFIIGASAHSLKAAADARRANADFATFSPVFPSPGKSVAQGLDELRRVCENLKGFPIIALGGINESSYESVINSGAAGFAAIRFLNDERSLRELALRFKNERKKK